MASATVTPEPSDAPATLIRMMDGRITFWSPAMEKRYGFTREQALGQVAHELLRTTFWHPLHEIEAALVEQNPWTGGLIHRHADGRPLMVATHWHFHPDLDGRGAHVTELHSDIVQGGTVAGCQLADVLASMAHELSKPLTAISSYVSASQLDLQRGWPDRTRQRVAMARTAAELARTTEVLRLLRALSEVLRDTTQFEGVCPPGAIETE